MTLTLGLTAINVGSQIFTERANPIDLASHCDALSEFNIVALFAEKLFRLGLFTIMPSVWLEYNEQSINERRNVSKPLANLLNETRKEFVALGEIAATFNAPDCKEIYGNRIDLANGRNFYIGLRAEFSPSYPMTLALRKRLYGYK